MQELIIILASHNFYSYLGCSVCVFFLVYMYFASLELFFVLPPWSLICPFLQFHLLLLDRGNLANMKLFH